MNFTFLPMLAAPSTPAVEGKNICIEFNELLHSRATARLDGKQVVIGPFAPSEFLTTLWRRLQPD